MLKKVLIIILVILLLVLGGMLGYLWYQSSHIFVEDAVYAKKSEVLDLRGQDISEEHYKEVAWQLPQCQIYWDVPFQGGRVSNDTTALTVTELSEQDIAQLKYFPGLKTVDAMGCDDYAQLEALKAQYPQLEVRYQVSLGAKSFDPGVTELTLENGEYDFDTLMQNLVHLPQVKSIGSEPSKSTLAMVSVSVNCIPLSVAALCELLAISISPFSVHPTAYIQ